MDSLKSVFLEEHRFPKELDSYRNELYKERVFKTMWIPRGMWCMFSKECDFKFQEKRDSYKNEILEGIDLLRSEFLKECGFS
ncbi:unnamed protein product, partial [Dovyalis caffra]